MIVEDDLLIKYKVIWEKVIVSIKIKMIAKLSIIFENHFHGLHDKEVRKVGSNYTCLAVISLETFHLKRNENYYLQEFLKECKYTEKEKKSG